MGRSRTVTSTAPPAAMLCKSIDPPADKLSDSAAPFNPPRLIAPADAPVSIDPLGLGLLASLSPVDGPPQASAASTSSSEVTRRPEPGSMRALLERPPVITRERDSCRRETPGNRSLDEAGRLPRGHSPPV